MSGRADDVLAEEYERSKVEVMRTVTAKLGGNPPPGVDLEAAYNEAWHALYLRLEGGEEIANRTGFLVTVAYRRALSEHRAVRLEHAANGDLAEIAVEPDIEAHLDAEIQLRHLRQGLRAELDERELRAATLCLLHGYSRPEAARALGVTPRRMEKLMDRATRRINAVIGVVRPGELCESFDSMVRAFAVGMLDEDGERYALARDHLADCSACRRKVLLLRGLGAVTPPLPALLALLAGAGAAGAGAKAGLVAKGGAAKGIGAKLGAKGAGLSGKAGVVGGSVAAAAAVAAAVAVAVTSGGGGGKPPAAQVPSPTPQVAGTSVEAEPQEPRSAPHRSQPDDAKPKHQAKPKRHAQKSPPPEPPPPEEPAPEEVAPAPEPEPVPEPAPEPAPEVTPAPAHSEPQKPITDAGVEFERR
jgi:DNA-directed RNA polymerase specialized sigma24 family protein